MTRLALSAITVSVDCQPRMTMNPEVVDEYATAMGEGVSLPPLIVFRDNGTHWLADGFHRFAAARKAGLAEIDCDVFDGDQRDAILYSVGANADHGLRRSNLDKRRAVETLLNDPEWSQWSDREIARRCAVSDPFVGSVRRVLSANDSQMERTVQRGDSTYQMQTANIGKTPVVPRVHGSIPADIMDNLFGGDEDDGEHEQAPLPAAINWTERDRIAADSAIRCREFVAEYDAQRVAYAVAANGADYREKVLSGVIELRLWLGELTHQLNELGG